jgi:guanosine-3',5'-bis(diphosphate) 3'-pyrophosphohydrolase
MRMSAVLAVHVHRGQVYGGRPYMTHLVDVWRVICDVYPQDTALQDAALLHDAIEDAPKEMDVQTLILDHIGLGSEVLFLVVAVTDEPGETRAERKAKTLPKTAAAGWRAAALKLADRLCNMRSAAAGSKHEKMYREEFPAFRDALYPVTACRPELAPLWTELEQLYRGRGE